MCSIFEARTLANAYHNTLTNGPREFSQEIKNAANYARYPNDLTSFRKIRHVKFERSHSTDDE
jgi:hypothetical protein